MRQSLILVQRCVSIKISYAAIRNNLVDTTQTTLSENSLSAKLTFDKGKYLYVLPFFGTRVRLEFFFLV